jgi:hypothetical protein
MIKSLNCLIKSNDSLSLIIKSWQKRNIKPTTTNTLLFIVGECDSAGSSMSALRFSKLLHNSLIKPYLKLQRNIPGNSFKKYIKRLSVLGNCTVLNGTNGLNWVCCTNANE